MRESPFTRTHVGRGVFRTPHRSLGHSICKKKFSSLGLYMVPGQQYVRTGHWSSGYALVYRSGSVGSIHSTGLPKFFVHFLSLGSATHRSFLHFLSLNLQKKKLFFFFPSKNKSERKVLLAKWTTTVDSSSKRFHCKTLSLTESQRSTCR